MTKTYYNEFDPKAAAWLRELITGGHIPAGDVDTRSIVDVKPEDLYGYDQCHFFAGIGGWAYALQLAGWSGLVWTGSCPCQPFSNAGSQRGTADERHLWPQFARLITKCQPPVVFGEQVASKAGREWLAGVRADLEGVGYAVGAADLCAAGVGAPHIRQRLFWVADSNNPRPQGRGLDELRERAGERVAGSGGGACGADDPASSRLASERCREPGEPERRGSLSGLGCKIDGLEHAPGDGWIERGSESGGRGASGGRKSCGVEEPGPQLPGRVIRGPGEGAGASDEWAPDQSGGSGGFGGVADTDGWDSRPGRSERGGKYRQLAKDGRSGFWSGYELIPCRDDKVRRVESGTFPLAHGVSGRVGLLRGYGNAIVPQVAAEFVSAFREGRTCDVLHGK